jgi:CheY-like chemotaxis protein
MYEKYLVVLSACLATAIRKMTENGQVRIKMQKGAPPAGGLPVSTVMEYQGRESDLRGYFVLGFPSLDMALTLANSLAAKLGLPPSRDLGQPALDRLGEFMNTVVGHAISAWDHLDMPVTFGAPSALQQAQIQSADGFENQSYLITLSLDNGNLIMSATFSQSLATPHENRRVLVVDDSRTLRHVLHSALTYAGYEVGEASDGVEAQRMYETFLPALVLMDLVMPQMGGLDAIMAIQEKHPSARFVVLTSSDRRDEVVTAKTLGVMDYILKPVDTARLLQVVKAACRPSAKVDGQEKARSQS